MNPIETKHLLRLKKYANRREKRSNCEATRTNASIPGTNCSLYVLSRTTALTFSPIYSSTQVWFQNRRAKEKRLKKDAGRQRWGQYFRNMKRSRGSSKSDKDSIQEEGMDSDAEVSFTGTVHVQNLPPSYYSMSPPLLHQHLLSSSCWSTMSPPALFDTIWPTLIIPLLSLCCTDEPPMSDISHSNGIYSSLSESSPSIGGRQGGNNHNSFPLEHGVLPSQDQFHDIRSNSPYGLPQSPGSLQALPRHQPLISSLVYPDSGLSIMTQGSGPGINPAVRVSMGPANGPSSDLSTGSSGGYPDFPASPASWLDEVDQGQF